MHQLEAWTALAALAALTERIEIIAAIKPSLYHPVVLAKLAPQIEHISGGLIAINLVNSWSRPSSRTRALDLPSTTHDTPMARMDYCH
jgi:alkanesulfonate monooxygenase